MAGDEFLDSGRKPAPLALCSSVLLLPAVNLLSRGLFEMGELGFPCLDFGAELCDCLGLVLYLVADIMYAINMWTLGGLTVKSDLSSCVMCMDEHRTQRM